MIEFVGDARGRGAACFADSRSALIAAVPEYAHAIRQQVLTDGPCWLAVLQDNEVAAVADVEMLTGAPVWWRQLRAPHERSTT